MNGLMVAFAFALPYHLLRTATAAGVSVHVLGNGPSRGLRNSRYCASFRRLPIDGNGSGDAEAILEEIRRIVERRRIDVVFPSDDVSTRLLSAIRDRLPVRATPLPDVATFDLLNDKWNFTRFALDHRVRVPEGWLRDSVGEVRRDVRSGALRPPLTLKPLNRSGGLGVIHIRDEAELALLDGVDYRPILLQRHITGETIGISVVCRDGRVVAHATQRRDHRHFALLANPDLAANVERLVAACSYNGPANFDAVLEEQSGLSYIVECNPRFWYTIYLSMIAGLNFLDYAFAEDVPADTTAATLADVDVGLSPKAVLRRPWRARREDWRFLRYRWCDPLPFLAERLRLIDDRGVAVDPSTTTAYAPSPLGEPSGALVV